MKRIPLKLLISALFIGTTFPVFADSGGSSNGIGQQAQATPATRTIFVKMDDINYSQKTIDVKPGETVRFVLKNEGTLMHEFNIGQAASQLEHQRKMATLFKDGTLTPTGKAKSVIWRERSAGPGDYELAGYPEVIEAKHDGPDGVLIEPGTTKEFVWTFPKAGSLSFACTLPGHYQAGMVGEFALR